MQKTNWFALANSTNLEERLEALQVAIASAQHYQKELLFWYLRSDMPIQSEIVCYNQLEGKYKAMVDANISEVPYRFSAKIKDIPNESWIGLAASDDAENRVLALEIAKGDTKQYQGLLRRWFLFNDLILPRNNKARWIIYNLLNEDERSTLDIKYQIQYPCIFDPNSAFELFADEEGCCWKSIVELLENFQDFSKIAYMNVYRNLAKPQDRFLHHIKAVADQLAFW